MAAARKGSRYGHRDATMILIGYRHGLRASELCDLQWSQVELNTGRLHVRKAKNGSPSVHPIQGDEIRALRRLQRGQGPSHVFMTERAKAFHALVGRIGVRAKMPFPVHPHMLRHGCGSLTQTAIGKADVHLSAFFLFLFPFFEIGSGASRSPPLCAEHGKAAGPHRSDGLRWPDNAALRGMASTSILADSCGSVVTIWG